MSRYVVLVEDEPDIVELIRYNFRKEGFEVSAFHRGEDALDHLRRTAADLIILDIMLPGESGIEICRRVRADSRLRSTPIIFVTAKGEELDRVVGLEIGGDDYVVKPFSPRELVARAKAVLRRQTAAGETRDIVEAGDLRLDALTQEVTVGGRPITLSTLEFKLLQFLASHPRQVFSRERLLDHVWGIGCAVTPRTVDVHIRRLREKIEQRPERPDYIHTVRGAGYRFVVVEQPATNTT
ncbi:MAG: winged helix-turn-helix domain-containing protein [Acidobacteria bacterium]|nr:winged helix-turn-helix domain-containing protein [Acidobacteriota bacterium]